MGSLKPDICLPTRCSRPWADGLAVNALLIVSFSELSINLVVIVAADSQGGEVVVLVKLEVLRLLGGSLFHRLRIKLVFWILFSAKFGIGGVHLQIVLTAGAVSLFPLFESSTSASAASSTALVETSSAASATTAGAFALFSCGLSVGLVLLLHGCCVSLDFLFQVLSGLFLVLLSLLLEVSKLGLDFSNFGFHVRRENGWTELHIGVFLHNAEVNNDRIISFVCSSIFSGCCLLLFFAAFIFLSVATALTLIRVTLSLGNADLELFVDLFLFNLLLDLFNSLSLSELGS